MTLLVRDITGGVDLQRSLRTAAIALEGEHVNPHHPIQCAGSLSLDDDGTFSCEHASAPPSDEWTQFCLHLSVGLLILELAHEL